MTAPTAPIEVAGFWLVPKDRPDRLHCVKCLRERWVPRKERTQEGFSRQAALHDQEFHR